MSNAPVFHLERIITFNAHIQLTSTNHPAALPSLLQWLGRAKPLTLPNTSDRTLHRGNADLYMSSRRHRTLSSRTMTQSIVQLLVIMAQGR